MTRIYIKQINFNEQNEISFIGENYDYLVHVLRAKINEKVEIFNQDYSFICSIKNISRKEITFLLLEKKVINIKQTNFTLFFSPPKKNSLSNIISKSVELGINNFQPFMSKFCVNHQLKYDKIEKQIINAVEQSERYNIPLFNSFISFSDLLKIIEEYDEIFFCDENSTKENNIYNKWTMARESDKIGIIIGPEGGFSNEERFELNQHKKVKVINLGNNILKSDTAAISAICLCLYNYYNR